jgi:hypothetical protein
MKERNAAFQDKYLILKKNLSILRVQSFRQRSVSPSCYPDVGGSDLIINCTRLHNDSAVAFCMLLEQHLAETIGVHELLNSRPCVNIVQIRNIDSRWWGVS